MSLSRETASVLVDGEAITLTATLNPSNATNKAVVWSITSGDTLGTISEDGLSCTFTPGSATGEVVVQVKTEDGEFTAICTIQIVEQIEATNLTSQFTWTEGTVSATANGTTSTADKNWLYSNLVDISAYSSVRFSHIQTSNAQTSLGFAFYTENQTFISGLTNGGTSYSPIERIIDVPANAKYIRVMWINTTNSNYDQAIHNIGTNFYFYGNP